MAATFVNDLKTDTLWRYRKYSEEELAALNGWLNSPAFNKEIVLTDNLWDNMKKLSTRVGMFTHPVFDNQDYYVKIALKDVRLAHRRAS